MIEPIVGRIFLEEEASWRNFAGKNWRKTAKNGEKWRKNIPIVTRY
jgi:hypothetical protein